MNYKALLPEEIPNYMDLVGLKMPSQRDTNQCLDKQETHKPMKGHPQYKCDERE